MTTLPALQCPACGSRPPADASFCPRCGSAVGRSASAGRRTPPWSAAIAATVAVALALGLVVWRGYAIPRAGRPAATPVAAAAPAPGISGLTPREQFDRLYDRVMQALQSGDTAAVTRFAPMALGASRMLDSADTATRRRAAVLRLHLGDTSAVRELRIP